MNSINQFIVTKAIKDLYETKLIDKTENSLK